MDIRKIIHDNKLIFRYASDVVWDDSYDFRIKAQKHFAVLNSKRILACMPLFIIMCLVHHIETFSFHKELSHPVFDWVVIGVILFDLIISALLIWLMYLDGIDNEKEYWKFKACTTTFWFVWFIVMGAISMYRLYMGRGGLFYTIVCVMFCLVPLFSQIEKIFMIVVLIGFDIYIYYGLTLSLDVRSIMVYTYTAMLIIGFVAQNCERSAWALSEYANVKAYFDPLTELLNRRGGNLFFQKAMSKAKSKELGIIMFDIDFFKKYNDSLGHDAGDECLKMVSKCLSSEVGDSTNLKIRHGGEEFVVLYTDCAKDEVIKHAEDIRKAVFDYGLTAPYKAVADVVTISVGVSYGSPESVTRYEDNIAKADLALYEAKSQGKNRVVVAKD